MNHISDYKHYSQNIRHKECVELVPLRKLWELREFDRRSEPKWSQEESDNTIEELANRIQEEGFISPIRIEFCYSYGTAIIAEGNHRLAAAIKLKLDYVPAIVYRHGYRNPKAKRIMQPVTLPYVVPELLRPTDIGIEGCLTLSGKPAPASELNFYDDEDEDDSVPFTSIMDKLVDAEKVFGGYELTYMRNNKADMNKLKALFNSGTDYLYGEEGIESDSEYTFGGSKDTIWSTQYNLDSEKPGNVLGKRFRNFLVEKLKTSKDEEFLDYLKWLDEEGNESRLTEMSDGQLLYAMQESEFDTLISVVKRVFYNIWKNWDIERRLAYFYTDYRGIYNGYMNVEEIDGGVTLSLQRHELLSYKYVKASDTSLKDILVREFEANNYGFDGEESSMSLRKYIAEDKSFDMGKLHKAFDKLLDMINANS